MHPMRVLVVDDEVRLAAAVQRGLQAEGFTVDVAHTGLDGLWAATEQHYDAIVLDIMLPGMNGYRVCAELRNRGVDTPILMPVSYTHLRAHETVLDLVCRLLLEKKKKNKLNS